MGVFFNIALVWAIHILVAILSFIHNKTLKLLKQKTVFETKYYDTKFENTCSLTLWVMKQGVVCVLSSAIEKDIIFEKREIGAAVKNRSCTFLNLFIPHKSG